MDRAQTQRITPAKRKRLVKTYGAWPPGYSKEDIELFLDLLYRMYSYVYTRAEIRKIMLANPFDHTHPPHQIKLIDLTDWLEALLI
ncbi:hypothetical protein ccbrp13_21470 [Ktedonobacteria bacterium brp13]|nr:hypothetical protein ccbrp13_21470 [Ktedonobacteria bacterium brp13]